MGCEKCKCKERTEDDVCGISSLKCSDTSDEVCIKLYSLNKGYRKASKGVLR